MNSLKRVQADQEELGLELEQVPLWFTRAEWLEVQVVGLLDAGYTLGEVVDRLGERGYRASLVVKALEVARERREVLRQLRELKASLAGMCGERR